MSAFLHGDEHLAAVVGSAQAYGFETDGLAVAIADANLASCRYSYPRGQYATHVPAYPQAAQVEAWRRNPLAKGALALAIESIDYQCCETPSWADSDLSKKLSAMVVALGAVDQSADTWAISEPPATPSRLDLVTVNDDSFELSGVTEDMPAHVAVVVTSPVVLVAELDPTALTLWVRTQSGSTYEVVAPDEEVFNRARLAFEPLNGPLL